MLDGPSAARGSMESKMEWLEVSVAVDHEAAEAVAEVLARYARNGVAIEAGPDGLSVSPVVVRAYLPFDSKVEDARRRVEEGLWHLGQIWPVPAPAFRVVAEKDWALAWKERMSILHVGRRLVIRPSWLTYFPQPGEIVMQLDPGMAFGTGVHPTTRMCLEALETFVRPGEDVLDLGTGSGILAIAAALLGAGRVMAVDNDLEAVRAAKENAAANGVQRIIEVRSGSLEEAEGMYHVVVVNILAKTIVELLRGGLAERVYPGGKLILAGLLSDQETEVVRALGQTGVSVLERRQEGDWVCLVGERSYSSSSPVGERRL